MGKQSVFEELGVLYRGMVLGLVIAAPVGPVGLLCIRRTVQKGLLIGFATGFGAAFADALFGAVAAFGVAAVIETMQSYNHAIHVLGGIFLLLVSWHTWHDTPRSSDPQLPNALENRLRGVTKAMIGSFALTLTNPATIFGVLAVVATFGGLRNNAEATMIVGGIFAGSALWWLMLSGGVALVRRRFTENRVTLINRITAAMLSALALWALFAGLMGYWAALRGRSLG